MKLNFTAMNKLIKLALLLIVFSVNVKSQDVWIPYNSSTTQNLNKIIYSANKLWLVGQNGTLLYSNTSGTLWNAINTGFNFSFNDLGFISLSIGYLIGSGGNLLKTTDYGNNWFTVQINSTDDLNGISVLNPRILIAGKSGLVLRSSNQGISWTTAHITSHELRSLIFAGNNYYTAGTNGTLYKSTDLGISWTQINLPVSNDLNCISYDQTRGNLWLSGVSGILLKSSDLGINWTIINTGITYNLKAVSFNGARGSIAAAEGGIFGTSDSGTTWNLNFINSSPVNYLNINIPSTGWSVGNNGLLLYRYIIGSYWNSYKYIDVNAISTVYKNNGSFNRNPLTGNSGFEWPKGENKHARYASGPWLGAVVDGDTLVAVAEYDYEFYPGYTDNNGNPQGKLDSLYRVYRLDASVNNYDRAHWPNALLGNSDQGAPVYFDNQTNSWKPLDFGGQTLFTSFTDSYPESHQNRAGSTSPLKADIKILNYGFEYQGALNNTIISRYMIINRSNKVWNNFYFALWTDDDVGDATDDMVACDTNLNLAYTYNGDNNDGEYGTSPPAVAFLILKGPAVYTGNNSDTSWICNVNSRINKIGWKDRKMDAFNWYCGGCPVYGDSREYYETYRMMKGLTRDGYVIINPVTNQPTSYFYSGDPVTGQGWVNNPQSPDDQRFIMSSGPVNMNPGDTQYIVVAQIIARGTSNLNSITVLKQYAQEVRNYYKNCFSGIPIGIDPISSQIPERYELYQNYPNPFNPKTILRFALSEGRGQNAEVRLVIYNSLGQQVSTLVNDKLQAGIYEVEFDGRNYSSGVYYYSLIVGEQVIDTRKMVLLK